MANSRIMAGFLTANQLVGPAARRVPVRGRDGVPFVVQASASPSEWC